jgi:hypothetical protein
VHEAAALCRHRSQEIAILEFPPPSSNGETEKADAGQTITVPLTSTQTALKRRIVACFEPRADLGAAVLAAERFHLAPVYEFAELSRGRLVVYGDEAAELGAARRGDVVASAHRRLSGDETQRRHVIQNEALVGASAA